MGATDKQRHKVTSMKKLIGKGAFSKAYLRDDGQVEVHSTCMAKECYALFSQDNPLAPMISKHDTSRNGTPVYLMPFYPRMRKPSAQLNPQALGLYKALRKLFNESYGLDYYKLTKGLQALADAGTISATDAENVASLASDVGNGIDPSTMRFEISPRNVSCDDQGNLILLDCFFCSKALFNLSF